jgi:hypothetical protein
MRPFEIIENINYTLLREQKEALLKLAEQSYVSKNDAELITGVITLMDTIQDCAVDELGMPEDLVFGAKCETCKGEGGITVEYTSDIGFKETDSFECPDCKGEGRKHD